jgi:hypothetical protein
MTKVDAVMGAATGATVSNAPPIYLDNQATTPTDPRVLEAMLPYFTVKFGNPHSSHAFGREAAAAVETARGQVASLIGADPREIVFTSGATESNNVAIKGAARFARAHVRTGATPRNRVVALATEHKCVLESARALEREGFGVDILPVRPDGLVDLDRLADALAARVAERLADQPPADALLDAKAAGALLGVPASWLLREARADRVPHVRLGHYVRFDRDELIAWRKAQTRGPKPLRRREAA